MSICSLSSPTPDGRAVVLPERIWEDKIIKAHPELRAHSTTCSEP
jgi:hypothetical protein